MKATVQTPAHARKGRRKRFIQMELPQLPPQLEFQFAAVELVVDHQAVELVVDHQAVELVVDHQAVELVVDPRRVCHSAMTNMRVRPLRASARRCA